MLHRDDIEALKILLARPRDWRPQALAELRQALRRHDFPEENLRRAHGAPAPYRALADVISMVKHAAAAEQSLLSAEERVGRAVDGIIAAAHTFSPEQTRWLGFIRQHLLNNLYIDAEDLDAQPVFNHRGGLARARQVFGGQLDPLLAQLNFAPAT